ncbi:DNRLRE domain-containing protein [Micromonospora sp. DR5-3]|uniref:DNRLRE domain-containing protein n=1 Tax=unclassified Micromonospora TaxID=2617518 RepID=UPI0016527D8F|nr:MULTISPECIES: DNRLRE domain-containing protein [unclassified Micromonospora]MCW3813060.1 DNRLRE domain-containing protein [Micromonospora sp. DR5-3]
MSTARHRRVPRRFLIAGLAAVLASTGALAVTGQPAAAAPTRWVLPTSTSYTDARQPTAAFPTAGSEDLPVGTWEADGVKHTSRAYFTFDLTPYRGKEIISAQLQTGEASVDDCDKPRELELWRTDTPATAPTWADAPAVHEKVGDLGATATHCPAGYLELLVTAAVQRAVDEGRDSLTLMARIAGDHEEGKHFGRRIERPGISLDANAAPNLPGKLTVHGLACADGLLIGTTTPILSAEVTDPDKVDGYAGDLVTATFAWWPVDRPAERTEWTSYGLYAPDRFTYSVPSGLMANGGTYAFAVKAADQHASSDWSPECRFTVDTQVPPAPTVSSTDYPSGWNPPGYGGPGIPGRFTFTSAADDVAGYRWGPSGTTTYVAADASGAATITWAPTDYGLKRLYVQAVDRTGNRSTVTTYEFRVRNTAPTVADGNPDGRLGETRPFTFAPNMTDVVEYVWQLNSGAEQTVAADADGRATVQVTPTTATNTLHVRSRTRDGLLSGDAGYRFTVRTEPSVSSAQWPLDGTVGAPVGTAGSFVFTPAMDGVTEYVYSFDYGEWRTVAAGADGTATVSYTPTEAYQHSIQVFSRTGDGIQSATAYRSFQVASLAPSVESTVYPRNMTGGGPGVTGTFTFRPHAGSTDITSYVYTFRGEPERTVEAGPDGTATIEWTPSSSNDEWGGWNELQVRARTAAGTTTNPEFYSFRVDPLSPIVSSDVFVWGGNATVGQTGEFVFSAQLPGTTEFVYSFDEGPEQTVAADAAGTARVSWTAESAYNHSLTVRSRTASGVTSGATYYSIWIDG